MTRKKIDNRIRVIIENGMVLNHRTFFVVVGDKGKDQVVILHHMLSKSSVKTRPSVLWCYRDKLGFSSHRQKRMRLLQKKKKSGKVDVSEEEPFDLFIAATNIRFCYYNETHKILGSTYGMLVLQDFEALTPNLMARTMETIEGGGIIVLLLKTVSSLKQLYTMTMDVHARYRTEAHQDVVGRFNERLILSLSSCRRCLVVDDQLNILPISSHAADIEPVPPKTQEDNQTPEALELQSLKESLQETQPAGALVNCCRTRDQAQALLKFIEGISEKSLRSTITLTAARGRGKSAALGLAIAAAVGFGYSNIFVTSPSPENLKTLFEFILKGFDAMHFQEHLDYELIESSNPEFNKALVRVNIFRDHRQTVQYIHPGDAAKLGQAELVVIDEAAAIPLPLVKALLGPYLVFMASTINGYEGTGRSLSLKLIQQLRQQTSSFSSSSGKNKASVQNASGRTLEELTLEESIRYGNGDDVEAWLNQLLCLNATVTPLLSSGCPLPADCQLFYVNRDTLFSYHPASELFLQNMMSLYVSSHYKNSPNDLQMLSDAPAHHLFCLLPPCSLNTKDLPQVLCLVQVCLEGQISKSSITDGLHRGKRAAGDLIPWTVSQQFQDHEFPLMSGVRIVRIATHPDYQKMGYGGRALEMLCDYYSGLSLFEIKEVKTTLREVSDLEVNLLEEKITPRTALPPLLLRLDERKPEMINYMGVSFGLTQELLKFWKKSGYVPVYLRQTPNELTGEHSCIMLKILSEANWLSAFWCDFRRRFVSLLSFQFRDFRASLALSVLQNPNVSNSNRREMSRRELECHFTLYDLKRLELYCQNLVDYHLIMDLLPTLAKLYFLECLGDLHMSATQSAILVTLGLQHKTVDALSQDLDLPSSQILGLYNKAIRRCTQHLQGILEKDIEDQEMPTTKKITMEPLQQTLDQELREAAGKKGSLQLSSSLSHYAIKGNEDDWNKALSGSKSIVSIKSLVKRSEPTGDSEEVETQQKKKKKRKKN